MRAKYQQHIDEFHRLIQNEVNEGFDHIENDLYPKLPAHLDEMEKNLNHFVQVRLPIRPIWVYCYPLLIHLSTKSHTID